jgi:hypothetical protein
MYCRRFNILIAAAAAVLLAACSNSATQLPASSAAPAALGSIGVSSVPTRPRSDLKIVDPAAIAAQVYTSAYTYPSATPILDYKADDKNNKKNFCKLTVGEAINAIAVDSKGELWVPQGLDPNSGSPDVVSFAPNCGAAGTTLSDADGQPGGIAFSSKGITYVDDLLGPSSTAGNVAIYPKGKTAPTGELTNSQIFLAAGVAVDSKDNTYVSYFGNPTTTTGVLEFAGGKMPGKLLKDIELVVPGVPLFDSKDNLLITDDANSSPTENVFAPPYTKKPKSFALKGNSPECSFDKGDTTLACGDKDNTTIDFYSYPNGKYLYSISKGLTASVVGVAQDPN